MSRSNPQRRGFAFVVTALWVSAVLGLLSSCSGSSIEDEQADRQLPEIELQGNELTHYSEEGKPVWVLRARSVEYFEEAQQTRARGVEVRFWDRDGADALIVQADQLTFYHRSGDLTFSGNLRARDPAGLHFSTDAAYWEEKARVLRSDSPVHVEREDLTLTGQGFEYRPDEGTLTIQDAHLKLILKEQP